MKHISKHTATITTINASQFVPAKVRFLPTDNRNKKPGTSESPSTEMHSVELSKGFLSYLWGQNYCWRRGGHKLLGRRWTFPESVQKVTPVEKAFTPPSLSVPVLPSNVRLNRIRKLKTESLPSCLRWQCHSAEKWFPFFRNENNLKPLLHILLDGVGWETGGKKRVRKVWWWQVRKRNFPINLARDKTRMHVTVWSLWLR